MGERTFPDPIYDDKFAASFGLPAGTKIIGPPMNDSLLTTRPDGQRGEVLRYKGPWPPPKDDETDPQPVPPKPTAADPPPPEIVPRERQALAIVTSPDVCRSPNAAIPYQSWGMGFNDQEFSPNVRANGEIIKLQTSKFCCCYGDEPGVGLGVVSNTRGDVVEPVTSSTIVRANGQWVQRHTDTCTLNNGNAPGEYVNPKSEQTDKAPDGKDEQNKTRDEKIAEYAESKGWTRASDGGWNTNPGGVGWASNDKIGEEMDYVNSGRGNVKPFSMGGGDAQMSAYEPSWSESVRGWVQNRLIDLGMDRYDALQWGEKAETITGLAPVSGNAISVDESKRAFGDGHYLLGAIHAAGALPIPGAGKIAEKFGVKVVANATEEQAAKEAAERLAKNKTETAARKKVEEEAAEALEKKRFDEAAASESGEQGVRVTARLKGEDIHLPNTELKRVDYKKRKPEDKNTLRNKFDSSERKKFVQDLVKDDSNMEHFKRLGMTENDIARMKDGYVPEGFQVHHKLPLDDGGDNSFSNLVLIKNDPYHKALTAAQKSLTNGMTPGMTRTFDWPIPNGSIYP